MLVSDGIAVENKRIEKNKRLRINGSKKAREKAKRKRKKEMSKECGYRIALQYELDQ